MVYTEHGFAMYRISATLRGAIPIKAKETNRFADVDNILKKCNNKTKIVFLANPNNPTGTFIDEGKIKYLLDKLSDNILMVIDGAYAEYIENFDAGLSLVNNHNNLIYSDSNYMLYCRYAKSTLIKDVELRNSSGDGLYLDGSTRVSVENSTIVDGWTICVFGPTECGGVTRADDGGLAWESLCSALGNTWLGRSNPLRRPDHFFW